MITEADLSDGALAAQLHAVTQAAYTLEAERIACSHFPPLRESLEELRTSSDTFLVLQESGSVLGALSFQRSTECVTITRLVVSPAHLRQGVATALLAELERRVPPAIELTVATAQANTAAIALYQRFAYTSCGFSDSPEGIPLLRLAKLNGRNG